MEKLAYRIDELRPAAGLTRSKAYEEMAAGRLRFVRSGGVRLVLADDLRKYLESLANAETPESPAA